MTGKNWQAGGNRVGAAVGLYAALAAGSGDAWAATGDVSPDSHVAGIGVAAVCLLAAVFWMTSALRKARRSRLRRDAFERNSLSRELEETKRFLETVVD